jgi:glycosyltransferase involved in cell wall biosynthesis
MKKEILIIAIGFLPNIGGLETHLKDLIEELIKNKWKVVVLTYQPLNTPVMGKWIESAKNLIIYRLPIIRGLFYKFLKSPILEFLFLGPLLFLTTPIVLLKYRNIHVINAQGIIAGFSASFWKKVFNKRYVVSAQSVYNFPKNGLYRTVSRWIFNSADKIVAISSQSKNNIASLGINKEKIIVYTNWENSKNYRLINKENAKKKISFDKHFIVSFFGRLVEEKGIIVLLESVKLSNPKITFLVYGEGPLKDVVIETSKQYKNLHYMGTVTPQALNLNYAAADLVVMPSLHEEGFGRVASGALLSGTPVIVSNKGALPEVVNNSVGKVVEPTSKEIAKSINSFYSDRVGLEKCTKKTRGYALERFNSKNAKPILDSYT